MNRAQFAIVTATVVIVAAVAFAGAAPETKDDGGKSADLYSGKFFKSEESATDGSVNGISYKAIAGTLVVHPQNWNDSAQNGGTKNPDAKEDESSAETSMFFVYYAKKDARPAARPITFI